MDITSFILLGIIIIVILNTIYSTKYKVVNMPSAPNTRKAIIEDLKEINPKCENFVIYDCGSGWGGLCRNLCKAFPMAKVTGIEISPIPFLVSYLNPFRQYKIKRDNLFNIDLSQANVLIFYLSPYHMDQLSDLLKTKAKKGSVIYSQGFPIHGWNPSREYNVRYALEKKLYRYDL